MTKKDTRNELDPIQEMYEEGTIDRRLRPDEVKGDKKTEGPDAPAT